MKVYVDTSVFGGVFDRHFAADSIEFFDAVAVGGHVLVVSSVVEDEIEHAPDRVRQNYQRVTAAVKPFKPTPESVDLRDAYLAAKVVTAKSAADAAHVAIATILGCEVIVSWNFKHIVHAEKIAKYNVINIANGYNPIQILKPTDFVAMKIAEKTAEYDPQTQDEPDCVKWKREWQREMNEKLQRMNREQTIEYFHEMHEAVMARRAEAMKNQPDWEKIVGMKRGTPGYTARVVEAIKRGEGVER